MLLPLLRPGEPLLVGVSGGADSVALLDLLVAGGWRPHVCHLNHAWRGAASDADAAFVRRLAASYGLPATIARRRVPKGEAAARRARHAFFAAVAARTGIHTVALAHTADDQAETFLLRLLRGAGAPGLAAMRAERRLGSLRVVRPLLAVNRAAILAYLRRRRLPHREDASNRDPRFARNRVRHELLPLLERRFNPRVREVLRRTATLLREEDELLTSQANTALIATVAGGRLCTARGAARPPASPRVSPVCWRASGLASREPGPARVTGGKLCVQRLGRLPVALQRRVLRLWLEAALGPNDPGLTFDHVEAVRGLLAADSPSAAVSLPGGRTIAREYGSLRLAPAARHRRGGVWTVAMSGITPIPMLGVEFLARRQLLGGRLRTGSRGTEVFDAAALGRRLTVRTWRPGDRFQPLGMSATRKLQDFFVDQKIPRAQRGRVPLLVAADGRIAWVVGHRLADPFKVTTRTRRALAITATVSRSRS